MKKYLTFTLVAAFVVLTSFTGRDNNGATNYYGIPESLTFNELAYNLVWSSHPNDTYYQQEYIPAGNTDDKYKDMVLIDFIITDLPVATAVDAQVAIIKQRKKTDAVCNYQLLVNKNTGDYILDFLMSENDGKNISLIEWDGYHYKAYTDSAGHKGVLLFGVSHRAYGNEATDFLKSLRDYRNTSLKTKSTYGMPQIQIK